MKRLFIAVTASLVLAGCSQKDIDVGDRLIANCEELLSLTVVDPMRLQINNSGHVFDPIENKEHSVEILEKFYGEVLESTAAESLTAAYNAGILPEHHVVYLDYTDNSKEKAERDKASCIYYKANHNSNDVSGGFIAITAFLVGNNYFTNVEQLSDFWYKNNAIDLKTMSKDGAIVLEEK